MINIKKIILSVIFSPILLILGIMLFFTNIRKSYCKKQLLKNISLPMLDSLNQEDFQKLIIALLKCNGCIVKALECFCENQQAIIFEKNNTRFILKVENHNSNNKTCNSIIKKLYNAKIKHNCSDAILLTNIFYSPFIINSANKFDIKIVSRNEIEEYINSINQINKLPVNHN